MKKVIEKVKKYRDKVAGKSMRRDMTKLNLSIMAGRHIMQPMNATFASAANHPSAPPDLKDIVDSVIKNQDTFIAEFAPISRPMKEWFFSQQHSDDVLKHRFPRGIKENILEKRLASPGGAYVKDASPVTTRLVHEMKAHYTKQANIRLAAGAALGIAAAGTGAFLGYKAIKNRKKNNARKHR